MFSHVITVEHATRSQDAFAISPLNEPPRHGRQSNQHVAMETGSTPRHNRCTIIQMSGTISTLAQPDKLFCNRHCLRCAVSSPRDRGIPRNEEKKVKHCRVLPYQICYPRLAHNAYKSDCGWALALLKHSWPSVFFQVSASAASKAVRLTTFQVQEHRLHSFLSCINLYSGI